MSNPEVQAFDQLEKAVSGAVQQLKVLRGRLDEAQEEGREMKEILRKFTEGEEEPSRLLSRLKALEAENRELLDRLKKGREGVERLLARIRFLEEQS
jgi:hypothetical protein